MDPVFLVEMRASLTARALEIRATLGHMEGTTAPVSPDNAIGRLTRLDAMQATAMRQALARDHAVLLGQIERAVVSIDEGVYGVCRRCGEDIVEARLRARPEAFLCIACMSQPPGRFRSSSSSGSAASE
jgi:DnaK suppressor protein